MADQLVLDQAFLDMAARWADVSRAIRRKVGCLIVKDGQIISCGFNGTPSGFDNRCEEGGYPNLVTKKEVLHAESNALMKIARTNNSSLGATMYLTCAPCFDCAKLIIQAGISRVVYREEYRCKEGIKLLQKANLTVEQIS